MRASIYLICSVCQPFFQIENCCLGPDGIDKSKVSRICQELDSAVEAFRQRLLETTDSLSIRTCG